MLTYRERIRRLIESAYPSYSPGDQDKQAMVRGDLKMERHLCKGCNT